MIASEHSEEQLRHAYMVLRGLFEQEGESPAQESAISHLPALPPIDPGSRLSATDLLSSWFRPPTGHQDPWQSFFRNTIRRRRGFLPPLFLLRRNPLLRPVLPALLQPSHRKR
jgi:hypothetical protein